MPPPVAVLPLNAISIMNENDPMLTPITHITLTPTPTPITEPPKLSLSNLFGNVSPVESLTSEYTVFSDSNDSHSSDSDHDFNEDDY